jgi:hypothetical protein
VVHEGFILELTTEAARITNAVPWLDTDEGCLFAVRTPEGNDGGTEGYSHLWLSCLIENFCTVELTLVDLDGVVAPSVVGELHDTVFGLDERHLIHIVGTIAITVEGIHRLLVVKTDATILVFAFLHIRNIEGGMTTYLEMDLAVIRVVYVPDDTNPVIIEHVTDTEGEVVGIDLLRLLRRLEGKGDLTLTLRNQFELGITGEAVAWQMVLAAIYTIGLIVDTAHQRKEDRGVTVPVLGVCLPQIFLTIGILDAL